MLHWALALSAQLAHMITSPHTGLSSRPGREALHAQPAATGLALLGGGKLLGSLALATLLLQNNRRLFFRQLGDIATRNVRLGNELVQLGDGLVGPQVPFHGLSTCLASCSMAWTG